VEAAQAETLRAALAEGAKRRVDGAIRAARIPERYLDCASLYPDRRPAPAWLPPDAAVQYDLARARLLPYAVEPRVSGILVLLGERGRGKTELACALLLEAVRCELHTRVLYVEALDMLQDFRDAYLRRETVEEVTARYTRPTILVIDELHERRGGDNYRREEDNLNLAKILRERYNRQKTTVLISTETAAEFTANVGKSVMSRWSEAGEVFEFDWEDLRPLKGGR
jgi:DNA replication protein DnaC